MAALLEGRDHCTICSLTLELIRTFLQFWTCIPDWNRFCLLRWQGSVIPNHYVYSIPTKYGVLMIEIYSRLSWDITCSLIMPLERWGKWIGSDRVQSEWESGHEPWVHISFLNHHSAQFFHVAPSVFPCRWAGRSVLLILPVTFFLEYDRLSKQWDSVKWHMVEILLKEATMQSSMGDLFWLGVT